MTLIGKHLDRLRHKPVTITISRPLHVPGAPSFDVSVWEDDQETGEDDNGYEHSLTVSEMREVEELFADRRIDALEAREEAMRNFSGPI